MILSFSPQEDIVMSAVTTLMFLINKETEKGKSL